MLSKQYTNLQHQISPQSTSTPHYLSTVQLNYTGKHSSIPLIQSTQYNTSFTCYTAQLYAHSLHSHFKNTSNNPQQNTKRAILLKLMYNTFSTRALPIMLQNPSIILCHTAPKLPIMLNKWPYYAQILLIKWLMYYNLHFAMAD